MASEDLGKPLDASESARRQSEVYVGCGRFCADAAIAISIKKRDKYVFIVYSQVSRWDR